MTTKNGGKIKIVSFPTDSLFNNTNYLKLWGAQLCSQSAIHMLNFALAVTVYNITKSNQAVSVLVASYGLSALLFGLFAGVIVDHNKKSKALMLSTLSRFFLILLLMTVTHNVVTTVILAFLLNSITQFFFPAEGAAIPMIVDKKDLLTANSLYTLSFYASQIIGYVTAGILLENFGLNNTLLIIACLFLITLSMLSTIKFPKEDDISHIGLKNAFKTVFGEMYNGFLYIKSNPKISESLLYLGAGGLIIGMFLVLLPGYGVEILGLTAEKTSLYLIIPLGIGIIVGVSLINPLSKRISRDRIVNLGIFGAVFGLILMSLTQKFPLSQIQLFTSHFTRLQAYLPGQVSKFLGVNIIALAMLFMFIIGLSNSFINIVNNTNLQDHSDPKMRGRVYGVLQTFIILFASIPVLLTGFIADTIGIPPMLAISAIFLISLHIGIRLKYKKSVF